jgi:hypothetical protein
LSGEASVAADEDAPRLRLSILADGRIRIQAQGAVVGAGLGAMRLESSSGTLDGPWVAISEGLRSSQEGPGVIWILNSEPGTRVRFFRLVSP